jgi:hypothetical protein
MFTGWTPEVVMSDIASFYAWGVAGVCNNQDYQDGRQILLLQEYSAGVAWPSFSIYVNPYHQVDYKSFTNYRMLFYTFANWNSSQNSTSGDNVRKYVNGFNFEGFALAHGNALALRHYIRDFSSGLSVMQGGYEMPLWGDNIFSNKMSAMAMMSANAGSYISTFSQGFETNLLWQSVALDALQSAPQLQNDYTTNQGSAWLKPLVNGRFAVYLENESTNSSTNILITLPPVPLYSAGWNLTNVWNGSSLGNFTGSFTTNLPVGGSFFGILTPLMGSVSNTLAPASITFPATTVNWTNTFGVAITLYIDNTAVTGTSLSINGGVVFSGLSLDETITLQSGDFFSEAYTIGTPTAKWHPYP